MPDDKPFDYGEKQPDGQHKHHPTLPIKDQEFIRPVRRTYFHLKCQGYTTMGKAIAETYAIDPKYYGATFCSNCRDYFPVGEKGEFVWVDDPGTGKPTEEKVGT